MYSVWCFNKTMGLSWNEAGDQQWQTVGVGGKPGRILCRKPGFLFQTCFSPSVSSQKMAPQHTWLLPPAKNSQVLLAHPFSLSPSTPLQFCLCSHPEKGTISRPGQCPAQGVHPGRRAVGLYQQLPASLGRKWRVGFIVSIFIKTYRDLVALTALAKAPWLVSSRPEMWSSHEQCSIHRLSCPAVRRNSEWSDVTRFVVV